MARFATLACAFALLLTACGTKEGPPPAVPAPATTTKTATPTMPPAPKEVPQTLKDQIAAAWPSIEKAGKEFEAKFAEADAAKAAGDREKMAVAIEAARTAYENALEGWNEIYYSVDDYPETQAEACRQYLRQWNTYVDSWTKKAKGLKEFSTVK